MKNLNDVKNYITNNYEGLTISSNSNKIQIGKKFSCMNTMGNCYALMNKVVKDINLKYDNIGSVSKYDNDGVVFYNIDIIENIEEYNSKKCAKYISGVVDEWGEICAMSYGTGNYTHSEIFTKDYIKNDIEYEINSIHSYRETDTHIYYARCPIDKTVVALDGNGFIMFAIDKSNMKSYYVNNNKKSQTMDMYSVVDLYTDSDRYNMTNIIDSSVYCHIPKELKYKLYTSVSNFNGKTYKDYNLEFDCISSYFENEKMKYDIPNDFYNTFISTVKECIKINDDIYNSGDYKLDSVDTFNIEKIAS